jgi:hypothetical protein
VTRPTKWLRSRALVLALPATIATLLFSTPASAYSLQSEPNTKGCDGDGSGCIVFCNNGNRAGEMYFNGGRWTDGVKWDQDKDAEARKICAANGTGCT